MQIKKYEAVDMQEAIKLIKKDLGPDAVILSTREIKKGNGIFGMFSRQVVEVVAARDYTEKAKDRAEYAAASDVSSKNNAVSEEFLKNDIVRGGGPDFSATPLELREVRSEIGILKSYVQELLRNGEDEQLKGLSAKLVLFYRKLLSVG
ncbi:MAG: hypothetical protein PH343_10565, partial [Nitrospira sp.]|nr:hypothetical protein [Nitrospira sp.]